MFKSTHGSNLNWFIQNRIFVSIVLRSHSLKADLLLQVRRIADLYFMMKLWKPAYNYYYIAKKDFQSDEAWPYYASAVECAALSMFMLSSVEPGIT